MVYLILNKVKNWYSINCNQVTLEELYLVLTAYSSFSVTEYKTH